MDLMESKVIHDQINNSPAKQQYTIPRQKRFNNTRLSYCQTPFYELPSSINQRSSGIGYGTKSDFTRNKASTPAANKYSLSSLFDKNQEKLKGSSIGLSRDLVKFMSFQAKRTPGPGTYQPEKNQTQLKYSLGGRFINHQLLTTVRYNPGPGEYEIKGTNPQGFYYIAKDSSQKAPVINPPSSIRFKPINKNILNNPGAGTYSLESIKSDGKYRNSKFQNPSGGRWGTGDRFYVPKQKLTVPPPGNYRQLSEFGDIDYPPIRKIKSMNTMSKTQPSIQSQKQEKEIVQKQNTQQESTGQPTTQNENDQQQTQEEYEQQDEQKDENQ